MKKNCTILKFVDDPNSNVLYSIGLYKYPPQDKEDRQERKENERKARLLIKEYEDVLVSKTEIPVSVAIKFDEDEFIPIFDFYDSINTGQFYEWNDEDGIFWSYETLLIPKIKFDSLIIQKSNSIDDFIAHILDNDKTNIILYEGKIIYAYRSFFIYSVSKDRVDEYIQSSKNGKIYVVLKKDRIIKNMIESYSKKQIKNFENYIGKLANIEECITYVQKILNEKKSKDNFFIQELSLSYEPHEIVLRAGLIKLSSLLCKDMLEVQVSGINVSCIFASRIIEAITDEKFSSQKARIWYNKGKFSGIKKDKIYINIEDILYYISTKYNINLFSPIQVFNLLQEKKKLPKKSRG